MEKYWGYHLLIDAKCKSSENFNDKDHAQKFINELVDTIKMEKFGDLQFNIFGEGDKEGPTGIQTIQTSAITWHACNSTCDFYLDIFSCLDYNTEDAIKVFEKYYPVVSTKTRFIYRQA